ncbi:unnamed protein product [Cuscuta campestris]|uniref:Uncharacterized protein n=1 Tax=Cuscuta campestris TaxID=132261 RepID=A0A484KX93_9ASTE|nr:unnamed protein product [Cuscuta campestris]
MMDIKRRAASQRKEAGNGKKQTSSGSRLPKLADEGKKYEERYWLYYLSSKGENRAGASATAEESSSDNVLLINLTKTAKRKQVVSPSLSIEAPQNLVTVNLEVDDEDLAVYKPVFSKTTEDQVVLTSEAPANLEATAEDFQIFPETSSAFETVLPEAAVSTPQKQNQEGSDEELHQHLQSQVLEILTTACEISNQPELEIPENSSTPTLADEVPEIWTKKVKGLIESALASQHASFRQEIEQMEARHTKLIEKSEEKHSGDFKEISKSVEKTLEIISLLRKIVSNTMDIYASNSHLQLKEINKVKEQIASVIVGLQKQMSVLQMDIRSALAVSSANQVVTKDYLKVIIDNQKEAFKLFRPLGTNSRNRKMEVILQQHSPSLIPELPIAVKEGEVSYIPSHLNMTDLILEAQRSNPENSAQHLSSSGLDGTEFIGTIVDHFSNDVQTEERRNNLRRIKELCGNIQGIRENRAGTNANAEESSSDNVLIMSLKKSIKRKQVVSPSPSAEAPQNLALVNLEEEEEISIQRELQMKKKRNITSPSTSGNVNPDELNSPTSSQPQIDDAENQFWKLYYDWRAWKVGNSAEQLLSWDQQLKNEKIIKKCLGLPVNYCCEQILDVDWVWQRNYEDLHLEHLVTSPVSEFEADDEDPAVYRPIFSKATKDQNQEASEEELQQLLQSQALEILTTPSEISNPTETEIPGKSAENLEMSKPPEANEFQEEQAVEIQRSSAEAEKETQMAGLETSETPVAVFEQQNGVEERDSLSRKVSNFMLDETEEESERTLKIDDGEAEQEDAESLPMQLFHRAPSSHQVTNFHFHSSSTSTLPDEVPENWTRKVQGLIESALASQHASFRQEIKQMEARHNKLMEKFEEKSCLDLKEISKSVDKTLEIISLLSNSVSNTMEAYASNSHLQFKEITRIKEQIATVTVSLQKQMGFLQMDIRSALAVSSANQVVIQDYLKVIAKNQKEAFRMFRHFGTYTGNCKIDVIVQHNSPSLIPQLPIEVKQGELTYIPSHLNMTELILEAQQSNPENSTQHLTDSGLDGSKVVGTIASHFSDDAQTKER